MKKKNSDIVIIIIGAIVLVAGILAYIFMGSNSNYFDKESVNLGIINNKSEVYQFLSDTKDVYCEIEELGNYFDEMLKEMKNESNNYGKSVTPEETRIFSKKILMKDDMMGLSDTLMNYANKYETYSFPKTVRLIKSVYEYFKISIEHLTNAGDDESCWENFMVAFESFKEAKYSLKETLDKEYKAIRGEDNRPDDERFLLNFQKLCEVNNVQEFLNQETKECNKMREVIKNNLLDECGKEYNKSTWNYIRCTSTDIEEIFYSLDMNECVVTYNYSSMYFIRGIDSNKIYKYDAKQEGNYCDIYKNGEKIKRTKKAKLGEGGMVEGEFPCYPKIQEVWLDEIAELKK